MYVYFFQYASSKITAFYFQSICQISDSLQFKIAIEYSLGT